MRLLKNLRTQFNRFCYRNRDKGIRNLMLYVAVGTAIVYLMDMIDPSRAISSLLYFDRNLILSGQVWRLITYPLVNYSSNILFTAIMLFCYYSIGQTIESIWGTLRFNLFYLGGVVMMDVFCMLFGGFADATYLNMSLFLAYATLFPDAQFMLFFFIPVKAWIFALVDLVMVVWGLIVYPWPHNLFPVVALMNYFLFFGKDVVNVLPRSWQWQLQKKAANATSHKTVPFRQAQVKQDYTHKCTVCGRTDRTNPELEFRYCSRCNGYYCYCQDHINNHAHIE